MTVDPLLICAVKSFQQVLRLLPEGARQALGNTLGRAAFLVLRERRRVAISNLTEAFPGLDVQGASAITRKCFQNLGTNFIESMVLPFLSREEILDRFHVENLSQAEAVLAEGKGMIALVFHYANWEIMGVASKLLNKELIVLAKPLKHHKKLNEFLIGLRAATGLTVIPNADTARAVMRFLREGKVVAILGDQREKRSRAVYVDFFGRKAPTSKGLAMIAMKTRSPVVPFYLRREGFLRYTMVCLPPLEMERGRNIEELIARNARRVNECLETIIRERPEEWFWVHRRWARKA